MLVSAFDYDLPEELIAQQPPEQRGSSRMLRLDRRTGAFEDGLFADLPTLLNQGDLLVLNDSRVLPARLWATRGGLRTQKGQTASGAIEVLLTEAMPSADGQSTWRALVKPAKKVQPGEVLRFGLAGRSGTGTESVQETPLLEADVIEAGDFGERTLRFRESANLLATMERIGSLPLPPYIRREHTTPNTAEDRSRYQTVYAGSYDRQGTPGSAAAPTAGLHFTPEILQQLAAHGIETASITLHVGLGTFQPVRAERTEDIVLHREPFRLSEATAQALNRAWAEDRRIVAVGTTATRTLEHLARRFESSFGPLSKTNRLRLEPTEGATGLFLSPKPEGDDRFLLVRGLLTNFHLPQSTLLMLISAFAGQESVLAAYAHAVAARYRFFSYGDCMLVL